MKNNQTTVVAVKQYKEENELAEKLSSVSSKDKDNLEDQSLSELKDNVAFFGSIKFWLIFLISSIVMLTVIVLSAIWLSSFIPSVVELSNNSRESEFQNIISFTQQTIREVTMMSEAMKYQIIKTMEFTPFANKQMEVLIYNFLKTSWKFHKGLVVTNHIGDNMGRQYGVMDWAGKATLFNITTIDQQLYYCENFDQLDYCKRNNTPDIELGFFDLTILINAGNSHPGSPTITLSFIDATQPQYTFITMVNSIALPKPDANGNKFQYYLGTDLSAETISQYLAKVTKKLSGSKSFIIEMATSYIIANDNPDARVSFVNPDGTVTRQPYLKVDNDPKVSEIAILIAASLGSDLKKIECNKKALITSQTDYVSVFRLCTDTDVDWLFVLAVPQWNYVSSIVIAVVCATIGALIIVSLGLVASIFISVKLVKPFYNLIDLFESVSHMDLDNLHVEKSRFTEVKHLQKHFIGMISRIKLYRAFIPAHLLLQLDGAGGGGGGGNNQQASAAAAATSDNDDRSLTSSHNQHRHNQSSSSKQSSIWSKGSSAVQNRSSRRNYKDHHKALDMFSLHLEKKKLTIMAIHIEGLNQLLKEINPNDCVELLKDFFELLGVSSRTSGGHVGNFENDLITMAFNASSMQSKHQEKAAQACRTLLEKLNTTKVKKWSVLMKKKGPHLFDHVHFRFAICCQESFCGNLGSNEFKNFTIISSARYNLESLIDVSKKLNVNIVLSDRIFSSIESSFQMRYIYTQKLVSDNFYSSPHHCSESNSTVSPPTTTNVVEDCHVYELGDSLEVNMDEWMYEVAEKEKKQRWTKYNQACRLFFDRQFGEAQALFQEFNQQQQNQDKPSEYMIKQCTNGN